MRVFVTGATGFVGSAVVQELIQAGHEVLGLARNEAAAQKLEIAGAKVQRGTIEDLDCLRNGARWADGAVHTAYFHAFSQASLSLRMQVLLGGRPSAIVARFMKAAIDTDLRAVETIGNALAGVDRSLVYAFPTMAMKAGELATEDAAADPQSAGGPRARSESALKTLAALGIRVSTVRLPPTVHGNGNGNGDHGLVWSLVQTARKKGFSAYVGDGRNRWGAVHQHDAARLFRLALENGTPGSRYHAVAEEGMPFRSIAEAIGRHLHVPVVSKSREEAAELFSFLAPFVATDNPASSALTQSRLGWTPSGPTLMQDLDEGSYFGKDGAAPPAAEARTSEDRPAQARTSPAASLVQQRKRG